MLLALARRQNRDRRSRDSQRGMLLDRLEILRRRKARAGRSEGEFIDLDRLPRAFPPRGPSLPPGFWIVHPTKQRPVHTLCMYIVHVHCAITWLCYPHLPINARLTAGWWWTQLRWGVTGEWEYPLFLLISAFCGHKALCYATRKLLFFSLEFSANYAWWQWHYSYKWYKNHHFFATESKKKSWKARVELI